VSQSEVQRTDAGAGVPAKQPTIGLALGGGGARGLAHILMLEVFDELGLRPHVIVGTSIGAIFGAAYASGMSAREIRAIAEDALRQRFDIARQLFLARSDPVNRLLGVVPRRTALLKPEALLDLVLPSRMPRRFDELEIPLRVVASDFFQQEQVVFDSGELLPAVAASMALPVLFSPVVMGDRVLMDGGLVNPLPFDVIHGAGDITVAIDVSGAKRVPDDKVAPTAMEAIVASSQILQHSIVREKLKWLQPDIYINVAVDAFHVLDFRKLDQILAAAEPAKDALRQKLQRVLGAQTLTALEAKPAIAESVLPPGKAGKRKRGLIKSR
jgi:NTE family protein